MTENEIATIIVDAAYKIHTRLGPGLLESVYETTLAYELAKRGLQVRRQQAMPVVYESVQMDSWLSSRSDRRRKGHRRNQVDRRDCSSSSKTAFDLLAGDGQTAWFAD